MNERQIRGRRVEGYKWSLLFFLGLGVLWQVVVPFTGIPTYLLPTPKDIVLEYGERGIVIIRHFWPTFFETMMGFLIGVAVGVGAGIGIVYSRFLWLTIYPALILVSSVPRIAIAPLILIWFGFGMGSKVIIALLVSFFPMVVNSVVGLSQIQPEMLDLGRTMGISRWAEFKKIRLPNSLPYLFAGFKASITLAVIGAVVGEFIGGQLGLGYLIILGNDMLNAPLIFASIVVLSGMSLALFGLLVYLERKLMPWRRGTEGMS